MVSQSAVHQCNVSVLDDLVYRGMVCSYAGVRRA